MRIKILSAIKQGVLFLVLLAAIGTAADCLRAPKLPVQAASAPLALLSGGETTLAQASAGRTAAVYVWGSWCGICRHTSPAIQKLHENGIPVYSIALRSGSDDEVRQYLHKNGYTFPAANDEHGALSQQWGIKVTPTIILLKNGKVLHTTTGLAGYWTLRARIALADALG